MYRQSWPEAPDAHVESIHRAGLVALIAGVIGEDHKARFGTDVAAWDTAREPSEISDARDATAVWAAKAERGTEDASAATPETARTANAAARAATAAAKAAMTNWVGQGNSHAARNAHAAAKAATEVWVSDPDSKGARPKELDAILQDFDAIKEYCTLDHIPNGRQIDTHLFERTTLCQTGFLNQQLFAYYISGLKHGVLPIELVLTDLVPRSVSVTQVRNHPA